MAVICLSRMSIYSNRLRTNQLRNGGSDDQHHDNTNLFDGVNAVNVRRSLHVCLKSDRAPDGAGESVTQMFSERLSNLTIRGRSMAVAAPTAFV